MQEQQKLIEIQYEERVDGFLRQLPGLKPEDRPLIRRAHILAQKGHEGQKRDSGEPYIIHPQGVDLILWNECHVHDPDIAAAGLIHDIIEDTNISKRKIKQKFTPRIARMVDDVTRPKVKGRIRDKSHANSIYIEKLRRAKHDSQLLKLVDILHNARTLKHKDAVKQQEIIIKITYDYLPLFVDVAKTYPTAYNILDTKIREEIQALSAELQMNDYDLVNGY